MPLRRAQTRSRCRASLVAAAAAICLAGGWIAAQETRTDPVVSEQKIIRAVAELADPRYPVRDRATRFLWSAGDAAIPALKAASNHPDPEISRRARDILADLQLGLSPDLPRPIAEEARRYRRTQDEQDKRSAVEALADLGPRAYSALARLSELEDDAGLRSELFAGLVPDTLEAARELVVEAQYAQAEDLLLLTITDGSADAARVYAGYMHALGKLDDAIQRFQQRAARKHEEAHIVLAFLHRAGGDPKSALASAQKAQADQSLAELLMLEMGEYSALARRVARQVRRAGEGDPAEFRLGLLSALQRHSGDAGNAGKNLDRLRTAMAGDPDRAEYLARMMLLNERPEEGIKLYIEAGNRLSAFSLLCLRQEFADALELAEKSIEEGHEESLPLRLMLARAHHDLGQAAPAKKAFEALAQQGIKEQDVGLLLSVISSEMESGLWEEAFAHAEQYVDRPEPLDDDEAEAVAQMLFARAGDGGADAAWWWKILSERLGRNKQALRTLRGIMEGTLPEKELKELASSAVQESRQRDPETRSARLGVIARMLQKRGVEKGALEVMRINAWLSPGTEAILDLGDHYANAGEWKLAAEQYQRATERDSTQPVPRVLWGVALEKSGDGERGRELMRQGLALLMGDDALRWELIGRLKRLKLSAAAETQSAALRRTGWFHSPEAGAVLRERAKQAWESGDAAQAASLWESFLLMNIHSDTGWVEERGALYIPAFVHRLRARAYAQSGDADAAVAEARAALAILPGDVEAIISLNPELRKPKPAAAAEKVFAEVLAHQKALLQRYPESSLIHNSVAWLLARTGRDLPGALQHATKAASASPRNTSILDTLAEVHFQMGQAPKAIEIIGRCIELEPSNARHRAARQRFEAGNRDTEPPAEEWY